MENMKPLVSIIIPTHKDAQIENCVACIKQSTYKNIEIIVVDEGKERSAQRNIGMDRAKGDYYLILDSDQMVEPKVIEQCMALAEKCISIYIPERTFGTGLFNRLRDWERQFYICTPVDVVRFVEAKHCPRFDETMSGPEDSDWDRRIQGRRGITAACIWHYDGANLWRYLKKKVYYAKSMQRFKEKWPNDKVTKLWYRCFWIFIEKGKWKRLIAKPHYAVLLFMLIFTRGIIYLCAKKF